MPTVPPEWQDLAPYARDILLTLALDGGASGHEIHVALGGDPGDHSHPSIYRNLADLNGKGLVASTERDGRTDEWDLTNDGEALVSRLRAAVA